MPNHVMNICAQVSLQIMWNRC